MSIVLVGSNWGENPIFGPATFNVPSALSNAAAIQAGDLILLTMMTEDSNPDSVSFSTIYRTARNEEAAFSRTATGSESAGWTFTVTSPIYQAWCFTVWRNCAMESSAGTDTFDSVWTSPSLTAVAATRSVLMRTCQGNIPGALLGDPTPAMSLDVLTSIVNQDPTTWQADEWDAAVSAGPVQYSGTMVTNSAQYMAVLVLLKDLTPPPPAPYSVQICPATAIGEGVLICA